MIAAVQSFPCQFSTRCTAFFYDDAADAHAHFDAAINAMMDSTGSAVHWWPHAGPSREVRRAYTPCGHLIASLVASLNGRYCVSLENLHG
jgi:hypothetical protein